MINISVKVDAKALKDLPRKLQRTSAITIFKLATDAQMGIINQTKETFEIRKDWWKPSNKYGIHRSSANSGGEKYTQMTYEISNVAPFMDKQEEGGARDPRSQFFWVPTKHLYDMIGGRSKIVPTRLKPRSLQIWNMTKEHQIGDKIVRSNKLGKGSLGLGELWDSKRKSRSGRPVNPTKVKGFETTFLLKYNAKGKLYVWMKQQGTGNIIPIYQLLSRANIDPDWKFIETGTDLIVTNFPEVFRKTWEETLKV